MLKRLSQLTSRFLLRISIALDLLVVLSSFAAAYVVVLGFSKTTAVPGIVEKTAAFGAISLVTLALFSVFQRSWRYVSISDLFALIKASVLAVTIFTIGAFLISRADNIPRSVMILTACFMIGGLSGARVLYRLGKEFGPAELLRRGRRGAGGKNVLICGLTDDAESFIRTTRRLAGSPIRVIGILDDAQVGRARSLHGIHVLGKLADLEALMTRFAARGIEVNELAVAEYRPDRRRLGAILQAANSVGLKVSRIPRASETASLSGSAPLVPKPIEISDLLGRPNVKFDVVGVARLVDGKAVLVTGAGGFIGSEFCRQIAAFNPATLIVTDRSEADVYNLELALRSAFPKLNIITRIVDVRDGACVSSLFETVRPDVVLHAAALTNVPLLERFPLEGLKTNVIGTRNVADAAITHAAATFVLISTDKAVNPANIVGATKRAAEAYCQALDVISEKTRFRIVRFGNVLGLNGSVVPRFQSQIAAGGPVTVTHPNIVRRFLTISDAVRLVLHASAHAPSRHQGRGKIMMLHMGKAVRILDLAERMILLAGYRPQVDIDIVFTGLRPGEKLHDEHWSFPDPQTERIADSYAVTAPRVIDNALLRRTLAEIDAAIQRDDAVRALELLVHVVPEYRQGSGGDGFVPLPASQQGM